MFGGGSFIDDGEGIFFGKGGVGRWRGLGIGTMGLWSLLGRISFQGVWGQGWDYILLSVVRGIDGPNMQYGWTFRRRNTRNRNGENLI